MIATTREQVLSIINALDAAISVTTLVRMIPGYVDRPALSTTLHGLHADGLIGKIAVAPATGTYDAYFPLHLLPDPARPLTTEQALAVLERAGWKPEPEVVTVERRVLGDRRAARFGIMEVVDRWRLPFRLSRIIEIVGGARNRKLTREDAVLVIRMIREHVRGDE